MRPFYQHIQIMTPPFLVNGTLRPVTEFTRDYDMTAHDGSCDIMLCHGNFHIDFALSPNPLPACMCSFFADDIAAASTHLLASVCPKVYAANVLIEPFSTAPYAFFHRNKVASLFAYDYAAMRAANAPFRRQLLETLMAPSRISHLDALGLT